MSPSLNFAWYLDVAEESEGDISGNYFLHQPLHENSFAINLSGVSQNHVDIHDNLMYGLRGANLIVTASAIDWNGVNIRSNWMQVPEYTSPFVIHSGPFTGVAYQDNQYYAPSADSLFRVDGTDLSYVEWSSLYETGSSNTQVQYVDPDRTVESYHQSIGKPGTFGSFILEARRQSKFFWRSEYTAETVNAYIKAGFE